MRRNISCLSGLFICFLCTLLTTSCIFGLEPTDNRVYYTDSEGNTYCIINENYFRFDSYNVLEVIVSDSERFILYDTEDDDWQGGIGEWIKDGVSYPIDFIQDDHYQIGGDIVISQYSSSVYWDETDLAELPPVMARIHNDQTNPGLYRWASGAYPYNWRFDKIKVPVQYSTYTREDLCGRDYIPEKAAKFYSLEKDNTSFVSSEILLQFDGQTGKGTWTLGDRSIPIIASFDQSRFALSVHYDTMDERDGVLIFSAQGTSVNDIEENQATFFLTSFPKHCNYDNLSTITITKTVE